MTPDKIKVLWFLPTHGDGRHLGSVEGARAVDIDYLEQVARAADQLGYYGVLLPTGRSCEDSWVVASALARTTQKLRFLVAVLLVECHHHYARHAIVRAQPDSRSGLAQHPARKHVRR